MLHLVAVFKTCHRIVSTRDCSLWGGGVRNWLINTSSEDVLQLAFLADAADEGLLLVRQMDSATVRIASFHSTVAHFVECVGFLFNQGHGRGEQLHAELPEHIPRRAGPGVASF